MKSAIPALIAAFFVSACSEQLPVSGVEDLSRAAQPKPVPAVSYIMPAFSEKCLDVTARGQTDGTPVAQYTCNYYNHQYFKFERTGENEVRLVDLNSGKCLSIRDASTLSGAVLEISTCSTSRHKLFKIVFLPDGSVQLVNTNSGLCLSVDGASTADAAALVQESCTEAAHQRFLLSPSACRETFCTFEYATTDFTGSSAKGTKANGDLTTSATSMFLIGDFKMELSGTYRFSVTAAGGVKVTIDGIPVIDQLAYTGAASTWTADTPLASGEHRIELYYVKTGAEAPIQLNWSPR